MRLLKLINYSIFFFLLSSCSDKEIDERVSKLNENNLLVNEIVNQYDSLQYHDRYKVGEKEYFDILNLYQRLYKILDEQESIIDDLINDDIISTYDEYHKFVFDYLLIIYVNLNDYGAQILDYENNYSLEYSNFLQSYLDLFSRFIEYKAINDSYYTDLIFLAFASTYSSIVSDNDTFLNDYKIKVDFAWFNLVFDIYRNYEGDIILEEIDTWGGSHYLQFLMDYIDLVNKNDSKFTLEKPISELALDFNRDILKLVQLIENDTVFDLYENSHLPFWNNSKLANINFINYLGFVINSHSASFYEEQGYFKDANYYFDKAIEYFNRFDFESFEVLFPDDESKVSALVEINAHLSDLFYYCIINTSLDFALYENDDAFIIFFNDKFDSIENLHFLENLNKEYADIAKDYDFVIDGEKLLKYNISSIKKTVKHLRKNGPFTDKEINLSELGEFNPYRGKDAPSIDFDINSLSDYSSAQILTYLSQVDEEYFETFNEKIVDAHVKSFHHVSTTSFVEDIKKNPESFVNELSIVKKTILEGYLEYIYSLDFSMFDIEKEILVNISEILLLEKINSLYRDELFYDSIDLYNYLFMNFERELLKIAFSINNIFKKIDADLIFTGFSEYINRPNAVSYYHIFPDIENNSFNINKISSEFWDNETFVDVLYDIRNFNELLNLKADVSSLQKTIYNKLLKPIESELDYTTPNFLIIDPLISDVAIESLTNDKDEYFFNNSIWIKYFTFSDFVSSIDYFEEKFFNSQEQNLKNLQRIYGFTKDKIDPKILAYGMIDYNISNEFYANQKLRNNLGALPWTEYEVNYIKKRVRDSKIVKGRKASETNLKDQRLNNYSVLHFATHGIYNYNDYRKSSIQLAMDKKNDGMLTYEEIQNLNLSQVELVFLSACQTGVARPFKNLVIPSIQEAFRSAGAKSVISTLWLVDDEATSKFVEIFYDEYLLNALVPVALRNTRLKFVELYPEFSHPYYWAAFSSIGF